VSILGHRRKHCKCICRWQREVKFFKHFFLFIVLYWGYCLTIKVISAWLLVGSWLFCIQHLPCLGSLWCMFGGSVEVWMQKILYWFIEGQINFGMPRGAEMSLALNKPQDYSWSLVGSWLFCIQHLVCLGGLWSMLGGSVEVWTKNILLLVHWGWTSLLASQEVLKWLPQWTKSG
jgi:hypothetical protein